MVSVFPSFLHHFWSAEADVGLKIRLAVWEQTETVVGVEWVTLAIFRGQSPISDMRQCNFAECAWWLEPGCTHSGGNRGSYTTSVLCLLPAITCETSSRMLEKKTANCMQVAVDFYLRQSSSSKLRIFCLFVKGAGKSDFLLHCPFVDTTFSFIVINWVLVYFWSFFTSTKYPIDLLRQKSIFSRWKQASHIEITLTDPLIIQHSWSGPERDALTNRKQLTGGH